MFTGCHRLDLQGCQPSPLGYSRQIAKSACCRYDKKFHERCVCKADVSFCKTVCDSDSKCKGYVKTMDGEEIGCEIATTSTCPNTNNCKKNNKGETGRIKMAATCGWSSISYSGCFSKLIGGLIYTVIIQFLLPNILLTVLIILFTIII